MVFRGPKGHDPVDARIVTREMRRVVWPRLREVGFDAFTGRSGWRYVGEDVDLVNFQSFGGMLADSVGCTSFSFAVNLGLWRESEASSPPQQHDARGRPRPRDYECEPHRLALEKSLMQPWFRPFSSDVRRWPRSFRLHRQGLKQVLRTEAHDRPDIWFVLPDGSNLEECLEDALDAIWHHGLPWFDSLRNVVREGK